MAFVFILPPVTRTTLPLTLNRLAESMTCALCLQLLVVGWYEFSLQSITVVSYSLKTDCC